MPTFYTFEGKVAGWIKTGVGITALGCYIYLHFLLKFDRHPTPQPMATSGYYGPGVWLAWCISASIALGLLWKGDENDGIVDALGTGVYCFAAGIDMLSHLPSGVPTPPEEDCSRLSDDEVQHLTRFWAGRAVVSAGIVVFGFGTSRIVAGRSTWTSFLSMRSAIFILGFTAFQIFGIIAYFSILSSDYSDCLMSPLQRRVLLIMGHPELLIPVLMIIEGIWFILGSILQYFKPLVGELNVKDTTTDILGAVVINIPLCLVPGVLFPLSHISTGSLTQFTALTFIVLVTVARFLVWKFVNHDTSH